MSEKQHAITLGLTRKSLEGTVIYACPQCGAPGVWNGVQVGEICPFCGAKRNRDKFLGELSASLPLWIWKAVLGAKWCLIKSMKLFT
jgi:predicted RNA-binding Zn-ribbon protein involved in translation (DUF1610 family)